MSSERDYTDPATMRDVIEQSSRDEWRYFDAPATWVLKTDRDFSIELLDRGTRNDRKRDQPEWASVFPNDTTYKSTARIQYRGAPFDQKSVLQLDEFRATVVRPKEDYDEHGNVIGRYWTPYEAQLSHIMSGDHLEEYFSGIDVQIEG